MIGRTFFPCLRPSARDSTNHRNLASRRNAPQRPSARLRSAVPEAQSDVERLCGHSADRTVGEAFFVVDNWIELGKIMLAAFIEDAFVGLYVDDLARDLRVAANGDRVHDLALYRELQLIDDRGETTARSLSDFFILHPSPV